MKLNLKKGSAVIVLSGVLLMAWMGVALAGPPWSDASASWWASSYKVTEAEVATVADGFPDGTFRPGRTVTRGQFAKMAVSGLGVETADPAVATFKDVIKSNIFFTYVEGAYAADLIGGYPSGSGLYFKPGSNITRQQANSILGRYLSQLEIDLTGSIHGDVTNYGTLELWYNAEGAFYLNAFDDAGKVASGHKATTAYLVFRDIVQGSNSKLNPASTLIRAQAAALVLRVKAEAQAIKTPPGAPTNLAVVATGPGFTITYNSTTQQYVGNDPTPQITGDTLAGRPIAIYDKGVKVVEDSSNSAGKFYTDMSAALADGTHVFTAKVKNANGLVSPASLPVTYVLDTSLAAGYVIKPLIPAGRTSAAVNSAMPEFTVAATDLGSGIKQVEFQLSANTATPTWQTISIDTSPDSGTTTYAAVWPATGTLSTGLVDGQYLFRALVTDNVGNLRTLGPMEVTVDTVVPTAVITAPLAGASGVFYTESTTPAFTAGAGDTGSGVARVEFYYQAWSVPGPLSWDAFRLISVDESAAYEASYSLTELPQGLPEGRYILAVRATDFAGNQSVLIEGTGYKSGVTQEVIVDASAPVVIFTAPYPGQEVAENTTFKITWSVRDATPPDTVKIEYTLDGSVWLEIAPATLNDREYDWTVPDVSGDNDECRIRITAVDQAGAEVGNVPGHTTQTPSGLFTIYDVPVAPMVQTAIDADSNPRVDGRDFSATWIVSPSTDIYSQRVYILPAEVALDLNAEHPVATFGNNSTNTWVGDSSLTRDSQGATGVILAGGYYRIWVVAVDGGGHTASAASDPFLVTWDPL